MNRGLRLVMNQGPQPGQIFVLNQDSIILGRDPSSGIVVDALQISRQHARITRYGGQMVIEDLRSANGTLSARTFLATG
jgi:pSer/pThr/pTyr-binding forkhead associated (FHA) protein